MISTAHNSYGTPATTGHNATHHYPAHRVLPKDAATYKVICQSLYFHIPIPGKPYQCSAIYYYNSFPDNCLGQHVDHRFNQPDRLYSTLHPHPANCHSTVYMDCCTGQ